MATDGNWWQLLPAWKSTKPLVVTVVKNVSWYWGCTADLAAQNNFNFIFSWVWWWLQYLQVMNMIVMIVMLRLNDMRLKVHICLYSQCHSNPFTAFSRLLNTCAKSAVWIGALWDGSGKKLEARSSILKQVHMNLKCSLETSNSHRRLFHCARYTFSSTFTFNKTI